MPDIMEIDEESQAALDKAFDEVVAEDKGKKPDPNEGGSDNVTISSAAGAELHVDAGNDDDDELDPETPAGEAKKTKKPKTDPTDAGVAAAKTAEEEAEKTRAKENAAAAAAAKKTKDAAADKDEEIDKLKIGRGASQADKDGWEALKAKARERKIAAKAAEDRAVAAEAKAAELAKTGPLSKEQLERLEALECFEFMHDPEKSGIVTREFDAKLAASEGKFIEILTGAGVKQEIIDSVKKAGLGSGDVNDWISDIDKGALPPAVKERLKNLLLLHDDTKQQRQTKIAEAAGDRTKFEGSRKEAQQKALEQHTTTYRSEMGRLAAEEGFVKKEETGTPEEKAAAKAHNENLEKLEKYHDELAADLDKGTEGMAKLVYLATKSKDFTDRVIPAKEAEIAAQKERADKAEDELAKIKGASRLSRTESPEPPKKKKEGADAVGTLDSNFEATFGPGE